MAYRKILIKKHELELASPAEEDPETNPSPGANKKVPKPPKRRLPPAPLHCPVCNKAEKNMLRNYGGISCFSCRAFFRRVQTDTNLSKLICKKDNNCKIEIGAAPRLCKKCRFTKCLASGMRGEQVLNDEGKRKRFRKAPWANGIVIGAAAQKKGNSDLDDLQAKRLRISREDIVNPTLASLGPAPTSLYSTGNYEQKPEIPKLIPKETIGLGDYRHWYLPPQEQPQPKEELSEGRAKDPEYSDCSSSTSSRFSSTSPLCTSASMPQLARLLTSSPSISAPPPPPPPPPADKTKDLFKKSMNNPGLVAFLFMKAREEAEGKCRLGNLDSADLKFILNSLTAQFYKFAFAQESFSQLSHRTQLKLLEQNSELFLNLIIGRAFLAESGVDQLCELTAQGVIREFFLLPSWGRGLVALDFRDFAEATGFLGQDLEREIFYLDGVRRLARARVGFHRENLHLWASLILFRRGGLDVEEPYAVDALHHDVLNRFHLDDLDATYQNIHETLEILEKMTGLRRTAVLEL